MTRINNDNIYTLLKALDGNELKRLNRYMGDGVNQLVLEHSIEKGFIYDLGNHVYKLSEEGEKFIDVYEDKPIQNKN